MNNLDGICCDANLAKFSINKSLCFILSNFRIVSTEVTAFVAEGGSRQARDELRELVLRSAVGIASGDLLHVRLRRCPLQQDDR